MESGTDVFSINVNTNISVMKPLHAKWTIALYDHLRNKHDLVIKGFEMAGVNEATSGVPTGVCGGVLR